MLFVKGDMAPAIRTVGLCWYRPPRPPTQVNDLRGRCEQNPAPARADRRTEIYVLRVKKESVVEEAHRLCISTPDEQTRTADPVDQLFPSCLAVNPLAYRADAARVERHRDLLT